MGLDLEVSPHVEMTQSAELGADNLLLHHLGRGELERDHQPGNEVLLDPELATS